MTEEERRAAQERQHEAERTRMIRQIEQEGRQVARNARLEQLAAARAKRQARNEVEVGVLTAANRAQVLAMEDARQRQDELLPQLYDMATAPLPPGRRRRSVNWRLVAEAMACGIEPVTVSCIIGVNLVDLRRAMTGKGRLARYLAEEREWRRYRIECRLEELDHAGIQAMVGRLAEGDHRVIGPLFQRLRTLGAPLQPAVKYGECAMELGRSIGRKRALTDMASTVITAVTSRLIEGRPTAAPDESLEQGGKSPEQGPNRLN
jgi:hypothetical protein